MAESDTHLSAEGTRPGILSASALGGLSERGQPLEIDWTSAEVEQVLVTVYRSARRVSRTSRVFRLRAPSEAVLVGSLGKLLDRLEKGEQS